MLLIAEIVLTIFAWRKGWKWYALIPMAAALFIGFILGMGIGASGGDVETITGLGIVLDVIAVIVLIILNVKGPKSDDMIESPKEEFKS